MLFYHVVTFKVTAITEILRDLYKTNFTGLILRQCLLLPSSVSTTKILLRRIR